jgi:hypothetical protein
MANIPEFLEHRTDGYNNHSTLDATQLPNTYEKLYGVPYPADGKTREIPGNPMGKLKDLPSHIAMKLMKLSHLDVVLRELLLATISLDGPGREKLVQELDVLIHELQPSIDKLMSSFGNAASTVLRLVPGLNIAYAFSDIVDVYKEGNDAVNGTAGSLNDFIDKVDDVYKRSAGSNRLMSSMMYALMDWLGENGDTGFKRAAEKRVGKHIVGPASDHPIDPDITTSQLSREFSSQALRDGLIHKLKSTDNYPKEVSGLLDSLRAAIETEGTSEEGVEAGMRQEIAGSKGLQPQQLLSNLLDGLERKSRTMDEEQEESR